MSQITARLIAALLTFTLGLVTAALWAASRPHPPDRLRPQSDNPGEADKQAQPVVRTDESPKLYPVWLNGKTGFIDNTGKLVIPAKFEHGLWSWRGFEIFSGGMARIRVEDGERGGMTRYRYGYIDAAGEVVIPPQYEEAEDFFEGLAAVKVSSGREGYRTTKDRYGYIDRAGRLAIPARFYVAGSFSEGLANVCEESAGCGYIDHTGRMVLAVPFTGLSEFREGVASALTRAGEMIGEEIFIDRAGRPVFEYPYAASRYARVSDGRLGVSVGRKTGFIDRAGRLVIEPAYTSAEPFSDGMARVTACDADRCKFGFIDVSGALVIKPQYLAAGDFSEGLAPVEIGGWWGYVDKAGRVIIKPRFDNADEFSGGLARVWPAYGWMGYIDREGKYVWRPSR